MKMNFRGWNNFLFVTLDKSFLWMWFNLISTEHPGLYVCRRFVPSSSYCSPVKEETTTCVQIRIHDIINIRNIRNRHNYQVWFMRTDDFLSAASQDTETMTRQCLILMNQHAPHVLLLIRNVSMLTAWNNIRILTQWCWCLAPLSSCIKRLRTLLTNKMLLKINSSQFIYKAPNQQH